MNNCTFSGNVGKPVTMKDYGDFKVSETTLAVKRRRKDKKTNQYPTDWFLLRVVGYEAERFNKYVGKGDKLTVSGEIETFKRQDGSSGFCLNVEKFDFPDKKNAEEQPPATSNGWQQKQTNNADPFNSEAPPEINEDDLPF